MNKAKIQSMSEVFAFVFLLLISTVCTTMHKILVNDFKVIYLAFYILAFVIQIGLFSSWTMSVYNRIMRSHIRVYLILIGANILLWTSIKIIKWGAFTFWTFGDRIAWYMYYIPMIMLPLLFFFAALCVGEDESYRPSKNWNFLFVIAIALILLVLTNDLHFLVFGDLDLSLHMHGRDYEYNIGYFTIVFFLIGLIILSIAIIIKKFSHSESTRKASRLPLLVAVSVIMYTIIHILKPTYGIGYYFMDVTTFGCVAAIAFWEACIRTGLIHSNTHHNEFFEMATTNTQILTTKGEVAYKSKNAPLLSQADFKKLTLQNSIYYDENTILHLADITGGFVVWDKDITAIKSIIKELETLNNNLNDELNILLVENEKMGESAKQNEIEDLNNIMQKEVLPYSEKIIKEISKTKNESLDKINQLIFETSVTSTYLKRKVNLILVENIEKNINVEEVKYAFLETFQILMLKEKISRIKILNNFDINLNVAILTFDFYYHLIEKIKYNFDVIYITYDLKDDNVIFTIQISNKTNDFSLDIKDFEKEIHTSKLEIFNEGDAYFISLTSKNK